MFRMFLLVLLSLTSFIASAETDSNTSTEGFVTNDLYIYLHSGPSKKYRILGSVYAGDKITKIDENEDGDYIKIEDKKQRVGWIAAKYFTEEKSFKAHIEELEAKLQEKADEIANLEQQNQQLSTQLQSAQQQSASQQSSLEESNQQLKADIAMLMAERAKGAEAFRVTQKDMQNQRMIYGAGILLAGLFAGRIFSSFKRRSSFLE